MHFIPSFPSPHDTLPFRYDRQVEAIIASQGQVVEWIAPDGRRTWSAAKVRLKDVNGYPGEHDWIVSWGCPLKPRAGALLEGMFQAKRLTLSFLWYTRTFVLNSDFTLLRFDGNELRHTSSITSTTDVDKLDGSEFTVTFYQPDLHYHIRTTNSHERDCWVEALQDLIRQKTPKPLSQSSFFSPINVALRSLTPNFIGIGRRLGGIGDATVSMLGQEGTMQFKKLSSISPLYLPFGAFVDSDCVWIDRSPFPAQPWESAAASKRNSTQFTLPPHLQLYLTVINLSLSLSLKNHSRLCTFGLGIRFSNAGYAK